MGSNRVVVPASEEDLPGIARIYNHAVRTSTATFDTEEKSLDERRRWFREHDQEHPVLVVKEGDQVLAWGSLSRWSERRAYDTSAEVSVYVDEASRGRGLGSRLMEALVAAAESSALHMLISRIAEGNEASYAMHRRYGFRHVGTLSESGRKFGRFVDVDIYERRV
jgi:L-amino acid N-acyltransferase